MMSIPQDLRFSVGGFSAKRMAYILSGCSLSLVPAHSWLPCEGSEVLGGFAVVLALITALLCWLIPRDAPHRLAPRVLAVLAFLAHLASVH
jgi:hypothetical protein